MNIKNLFLILLVQYTSLIGARQPDIDYEGIKKHLLETYTRPHVHQYKKHDYVVTSNNFLTDEKLMILARQAYKDDIKAQKTLSELRDEYQKKLYHANKEADENIKHLAPSIRYRLFYGLSGASIPFFGLISLLVPENFITISTISILLSLSGVVLILLPEDIDKDSIHGLDARIATKRLDSFIKNIEKIQRKCLTKKEKMTSQSNTR